MQLDDDIEHLFTHVPLLAGVPRAAWRMSPLGGITNRSYRLQADGQDLVLRWPGASASRYLDRRAEPLNAQAVAGLGLAPPVLAADPDAGWYITAFVTGAETLNAGDVADPETFAGMLKLLTTLHRSDVAFPFQQGLFKAIDLYIKLAPTQLMQDVRRALEPLRLALARHPLPRVACHIDPNPANFLRDGAGRLFLIDWEFAATEEPLWDLAAVTMEAGVDPAMAQVQIEPLIGSAQWPRFELYKTALNLVAASWCEAELVAANDSPDLVALRDDRLLHLKQRLGDPRYQDWLRSA
ncbi:choline/ethanolamine kinase family protein [Dongia rigui]|uniref:Choline/ethanolamine kinase family protein n=1 Tax=Dongia rigui TaxID=940149 RepID=A0ABU5DVB6_9PROT|nr:choline/ethanolamine kinase family protein [Dongia rigui]MDY0871227.1 choline/ethanolamine kinase family protein [Dongia rigui]